jgi:hypothetical protein
MEENEPTTIEEVQAALEAEQAEWQKAGLSLPNLVIPAVSQLMFDMQIKLQAMINVLIVNDIISEEELNLQYKKIMLNDMRTMRESAPEQEREAIRRQILTNAQMRLNGPQKPPWER